MANSRANDSTCGSSAKRANPGAFFTGGNFAAGTTGRDDRCRD
jgi:hypothetical protein